MHDISSFFCGFLFLHAFYYVCVFSLPLSRRAQDGDDSNEFLFNQLLTGLEFKSVGYMYKTLEFSCIIPWGAVRSSVCLFFIFVFYFSQGPLSISGSSSFSSLYLPLLTSHYLHAPKFYHSSTAMFARVGDVVDREIGWLVLYRWRNRKQGL